MRCRCGRSMEHKKEESPMGGEKHVYTCGYCRREVTRSRPVEEDTRVKVQAGAGQKVNRWY